MGIVGAMHLGILPLFERQIWRPAELRRIYRHALLYLNHCRCHYTSHKETPSGKNLQDTALPFSSIGLYSGGLIVLRWTIDLSTGLYMAGFNHCLDGITHLLDVEKKQSSRIIPSVITSNRKGCLATAFFSFVFHDQFPRRSAIIWRT